MKKIVNMCCDCAVPGYPCMGAKCPNRKVEVHYCDVCDAEIPEDEIYVDENGRELCDLCREDCENEEEKEEE